MLAELSPAALVRRARGGAVLVAVLAGTAILWELIVRLFHVPAYVLPPPSAVVAEFLSRPDLYFRHSWVTLYETTLGFVGAVVLGLTVAILIVYSKALETVLYPLLVILQIIPKVAIGPILVIWVGFGPQSKIVLALLVAFFPIVVDSITGMRAVEQDLLDLVRVLKGSRWQEFVKVRLPYSLPFVFAGLKVAITLAVIGAIIGEFVGGNAGLGYLILIANSQLNIAMSFAALTMLSLMGLGLFGLVVAGEWTLIPWARSAHLEVDDRSGRLGGGA